MCATGQEMEAGLRSKLRAAGGGSDEVDISPENSAVNLARRESENNLAVCAEQVSFY